MFKSVKVHGFDFGLGWEGLVHLIVQSENLVSCLPVYATRTLCRKSDWRNIRLSICRNHIQFIGGGGGEGGIPM